MKILRKTEIANGKWLELDVLTYEDPYGKIREWETVSRRNCAGAVLMIAELHPSGRLILIKQYRPPVDARILEFPAGLIDPGESPECAALRELREETGFQGTIRAVFPPAYNSPGLTGEYIHTVLMDVDELKQPELKTEFDESEEIETVLVAKGELGVYVNECIKNGVKIDAKVLSYAIARNDGRNEELIPE